MGKCAASPPRWIQHVLPIAPPFIILITFKGWMIALTDHDNE